MTTEEFVQEIARSAPTIQRLAQVGIVGDIVQEILNNYQLKRIPGSGVRNSEADPLLTLLTEYDLTSFSIGGIRFAQPPTPIGDQLVVGDIEVDLIIYNPATCEITFCDYECPSFVMSKIAKDGNSFLKALTIANSLFRSRLLGDVPLTEGYDARAFPFAKECSAAAGGDEYFDFYLMFLGIDERLI